MAGSGVKCPNVPAPNQPGPLTTAGWEDLREANPALAPSAGRSVHIVSAAVNGMVPAPPGPVAGCRAVGRVQSLEGCCQHCFYHSGLF